MKTVQMIIFLLCVSLAGFSATELITVDTFEEWSRGEGEGIRIQSRGISAGDTWTRVATLEEALVTDVTVSGDDLFIATGTRGNLYRLRGDKLDVAASVDADLILSLTSGPDGNVYFAASPGGGLYAYGKKGVERLPLTQGTVRDMVFSGKHLYIATASPGTLLRLEKDRLTALYTSPDDAVTCLASDGEGGVYAGTFGKGLIVHVKQDGETRVLWQDDLEEISRMALDGEGNLYFIANKSPEEDDDSKEKGEKKSSGGPLLSRLSVYRPSGIVEPLKTYKDEVLLSLHYDREHKELLYGTASEGHLYAWKPGKPFLSAKLKDGAVTAIADRHLVTQEASAVYRLEPAGKHVYDSKVFNAGNMSIFGEFTSRGTGTYSVRFRTGQTEDPGPAWSDWGTPCEKPVCRVHLKGKYAQFRVLLEEDAFLERARWSYNPLNIKPEIRSFDVQPPGDVYLESSYQPKNIVIQATNPDKYGIFTTLNAAPEKANNKVKGKKVYMKGYRTFTWEVEDPNDDELAFSLMYRKEEGKKWREIFKDSRNTFFSFDTMVLPDGEYRFKLEASDGPSNPETASFTVSEISPTVLVDNHPPKITFETRKGKTTITVTDALSPITKVEISIDGTPWKKLQPDDKIFDSREEIFHIPAGKGTLVVRAQDYFYNTVAEAYSGGGS